MGLERGREEVIVAGVIILSSVMELLSQNKLLVSDYGLREGVVLDGGKQQKLVRTWKRTKARLATGE